MAENLGSIYAELRLSFAKIDDDIKKATTKIGGIADSFNEIGDSVQKAGQKVSKVGSTLTKKVTLPIVGLGAAAVKLGADFDETMSAVQAISGATGKEFEKLREQAEYLGATTQFSAQDAADGMVMLARAGWDVESIMAAMPGLLNLAAAGNLDLATASSITADTMTMFSMAMEDSVRTADVFAKAANSANTTVELLGESMAYGGAAAAAAGMDIEQTIAIFAAFADAGIKGSRAGTVFEAVMRDMRAAVEEGHIAIGDTNIAVYDLDGNMRSLADIMLDVEAATAGMTTEQQDAALAAIFNTQALRGVNIMLETGVGNIKAFEGELYNSQGTAESTAATMRDNLKGAIEELMSAFEGLAIEFSDILTPKIRELTEKLTELTQWFIELDDATKETIVKWAAIAAVIGPVILVFGTLLGAIGTIINGVGLFIKVLKMLAPVAAALKGVLAALAAALGLPVGAVAAIIAAIVALTVVIVKNWDAIKEWLAGAWEAIVEFFTTTLPEAFQSVIAWFGELGTKIGEFFSNLWASITEWATGIWESITEWAVGIYETVSQWFSDTIDSIVTFFSELPGKIWDWLVQTATDIWEWASGIYEDVKKWFNDAINNIVKFFKKLPGKIWDWLVKTATDIYDWAVGIRDTVHEWFGNVVNTVVNFISELPGKIWTWLTDVIDKVKTWASDIWKAFRQAAVDLVNGFIEKVKELPGMVWDAIMGVKDTIVNAATSLFEGAKTAASNLWNGFKKGLGIASPSYLEEAMMNIMDKSYEMTTQLGGDFKKLSRMSVKPEITPFSLNPERYPNWGGRGLVPAGADGFSGPIEQVVRHEHTGVLEIRGTNDEGQLVDVVRVVMDELRREVRT